MKGILVIAALAVIAAGTGAYAWIQHHEHAQTRGALNAANADLQKSRNELNTVQAELGALRKQASEQQMALNQLQAEMTHARAFVEAEKAVSLRLREEMAKMKEDYAASLRAARAAQARPAGPMLYAPPKPTVIQGPRGRAFDNAAPAQ